MSELLAFGPVVIAFVSALLAIFGKETTWRPHLKGFRKLSGIGWIALLLASCSLAIASTVAFENRQKRLSIQATEDAIRYSAEGEFNRAALQIQRNLESISGICSQDLRVTSESDDIVDRLRKGFEDLALTNFAVCAAGPEVAEDRLRTAVAKIEAEVQNLDVLASSMKDIDPQYGLAVTEIKKSRFWGYLRGLPDIFSQGVGIEADLPLIWSPHRAPYHHFLWLLEDWRIAGPFLYESSLENNIEGLLETEVLARQLNQEVIVELEGAAKRVADRGYLSSRAREGADLQWIEAAHQRAAPQIFPSYGYYVAVRAQIGDRLRCLDSSGDCKITRRRSDRTLRRFANDLKKIRIGRSVARIDPGSVDDVVK